MAVQGEKQDPTLDPGFHQGCTYTHIHTHSDWHNSSIPINLTFESRDVGVRGRMESLEKTHLAMGRTCKLHEDCGPAQEPLIFFLNLIMKEHYSRIYYTIFSTGMFTIFLHTNFEVNLLFLIATKLISPSDIHISIN